MRRLAFLLLLVCLPALAYTDVSFDEQPGAAVPGDAAFREARLADYYGRAPLVLVLGYFGCVNLCGTTLTGVVEALRDTGLAAGRDYDALFVSIDPRDESAIPERRPGWHFLTGAAAAARVAQAVGFRYRFEEGSGQFAHPAGFVVLTPDGRIAQYFEGVRFDPREVKTALEEAAENRTQTRFQRLLFVCFHDPLGGRNTPAVMAAVRIAMGALLAAAGFFAWRRLR
jgi:protein SCO1/2